MFINKAMNRLLVFSNITKLNLKALEMKTPKVIKNFKKNLFHVNEMNGNDLLVVWVN